MRPRVFLACAVAVAGIAAHPVAAARAPAKAAHNWASDVRPTPAGGFVMGNPDAKVKLVEYGSMTCPHCARFDQTAVPDLIKTDVESGKVSWEFRNYVRDAADVSASLIARCNGAKGFFPLTRALYADQRSWEEKIEQTPQDRLKAIGDLPPSQRFVAVAKMAGLQQWAAAHGLPVARSSQCLANEHSIDLLVRMNNAVTKQFPDFKGTPSFLINGALVDLGPVTEDQVWPTLQDKIKAALKG